MCEANEKLASTWFPQCAPPALVTCEQTRLRAFLAEHNDIIIKPLDAMGLMFVDLGIIGDFLTKVNVTSPTCIRGLDIGGQLIRCH